jgi:hypothetical protein
VRDRYKYNIVDQPKVFVCPKCQDVCMCTFCVKKSGRTRKAIRFDPRNGMVGEEEYEEEDVKAVAEKVREKAAVDVNEEADSEGEEGDEPKRTGKRISRKVGPRNEPR